MANIKELEKKILYSLKSGGIKTLSGKIVRKIKKSTKKYGLSNSDFKKLLKNLSEDEKKLYNKFPLAFRQISNLKESEKIFEKCLKSEFSDNELSNADLKFSIFTFTDETLFSESIGIQTYKNFEVKKLTSNFDFDKEISEANGKIILVIKNDGFLHPFALEKIAEKLENADLIYTDEAGFKNMLGDLANVHNYKPDFSPDYLDSYNYFGSAVAFKKSLFEKIEIQKTDLSQKTLSSSNNAEFNKFFHRLYINLSSQTEKIFHIDEVLFFYKCTSKKSPKKILSCREKSEISGNPLVSIIIPTKDHKEDLEKCLNSILKKSTYKNFEIILCENNSTNKETFDYYKELSANPKIKIVTWEKPFNYSAINNFAVKNASGEYFLLLNNDTEIIEPSWIEELLMFVQRENVGAAGAKLLYPDNTVQHAGVVIGMGKRGVAAHSFLDLDKNNPGYQNRASVVQNVSCCTAACLMVKKSVWEKIGGFNEEFAVAFNDVDLCMRIRKENYLIVFNPFCLLYHYESKSRGYEESEEKKLRFQKEVDLFNSYWKETISKGDPYYNKNFSLTNITGTLKEENIVFKNRNL